MCKECEEEVQRQAATSLSGRAADGRPLDASLQSRISASRSQARPLPSHFRAGFEERFGRSLEGVRIVTGDTAARLNESLNARAFTLGNHVWFGRGQFRPESPGGKRLIAHELAHTLQQGGGHDSRAAAFQAVRLGSVSDPAEAQADRMAEAALSRGADEMRLPGPGTVSAQPAVRRAGETRTAVVTVRWIEDDVEFYHRLVEATAGSKGFRGVGKSALWQPMHDPAKRFFRRYSMDHPGANPGDRIRIEVSAGYDKQSFGASVYNLSVREAVDDSAKGGETKSPEKSAEKAPDQAATEEGKWAKIETGWFGVAAGSRVITQYLLSPDEIKPLGMESKGGKPPPESKSVSTAKLEKTIAQFMALGRSGLPKVYEFEYRYEGGEWILHRWVLLATIHPKPVQDPAAAEPGEPFLDEGERIIEEIRGTRQMILSTAATLIAEQDPTRLENILTSVGPFAVVKVAKIGKLSRLRRLAKAKDLLKTLKTPKAIPWGRTTGKMDPKLVEMAKELRATQAGVSKQAFRETNIATARVRIDGKVDYLSAGNARNAAHSEELIHSQIHELKKNHNVALEQLYSERIPCKGACGPLLDGKYPDVQVFFTTKAGNSGGRVSDLMTAYGVSP